MQIPESRITLIPSHGGSEGHGLYSPPNFPSIKLPVTIEWSSCGVEETSGILEQYQSLQSMPNAVRPRCLGFFESSNVGRIGFVFADRDIKVQLSLPDLIKYKPKPNAHDRKDLAVAVVDCVKRMWQSTQGKYDFPLWSRNVWFLDRLDVSDIPVSAAFLSGFAPPIVSPVHPDPERLLYLHPSMWDHGDPLRAGSNKKLDSVGWPLGIVLLEISDWRSFRDILSLGADPSISDMRSAVSNFWETVHNPSYVLKSHKVTKVVKFCLDGNSQSQDMVPEYCDHVRRMLLE